MNIKWADKNCPENFSWSHRKLSWNHLCLCGDLRNKIYAKNRPCLFRTFFSIRFPHYLNLRSGSIFVLAVAVRECMRTPDLRLHYHGAWNRLCKFWAFREVREVSGRKGYDWLLIWRRLGYTNTSQWVDACKNQNESCSVEVAGGDFF